MYYRCPASAITSQKTTEDLIYMIVCDPDKHNHVPNIVCPLVGNKLVKMHETA